MGSSPRTRGKDLASRAGKPCLRFIHAKAGESFRRRRILRQQTVHPREGGGKMLFLHAVALSWGSSTRRRGKVCPQKPVAANLRFIHAKAGESLLLDEPLLPLAVHPREGRGKGERSSLLADRHGSSTRRRGKANRPARLSSSARFIHAKAEESTRLAGSCTKTRVHPREGGGKAYSLRHAAASDGSSTRRRGKGSRVVLSMSGLRFIRAKAGESASDPRARLASQVHPREGGGKTLAHVGVRVHCGSSTRTRGKVEVLDVPGAGEGFIHANAGERCSRDSHRARSTVHPRERGGKQILGSVLTGGRGSSTRTRGKDQIEQASPGAAGFIHANAGESSAFGRRSTSPGVHPRERGGKHFDLLDSVLGEGSSTRTRGKAHFEQQSVTRTRFIPANAGLSKF